MTRLSVLLLLGLAACQPALLGDIEEARAEWTARGTSDYTWVVQRGCFCPDADPVEVEVIGGEVSRAFRQIDGGETEQELDPSEFEAWMTVEGLFEEAERAVLEADSVTLGFAEEGYPTLVDVDWMRMAIDDEVSFTAGDLLPLDVN